MDRNAAHFFALLVIVFLAAGQFASAEEHRELHPWLDSKFAFDVGVFFPDRSNRLRATGSFELDPQPTPFVDFGSEFKLTQSDSIFSAELAWKYGKRWSLRMQYFDSEGSNTAILEED
ncbi:MAG: hypothetical protein KAJ57_06495, partial [Woeseiaceae bacterium]|nr:hypothetical protein [Woeseiaceae bacterium]